jgi:hypothetical protein
MEDISNRYYNLDIIIYVGIGQRGEFNVGQTRKAPFYHLV